MFYIWFLSYSLFCRSRQFFPKFFIRLKQVFALKTTLVSNQGCSFRYGNFDDFMHHINEHEGSIEEFANGFRSMGCHVDKDNNFVVKQWAPGALVTLSK